MFAGAPAAQEVAPSRSGPSSTRTRGATRGGGACPPPPPSHPPHGRKKRKAPPTFPVDGAAVSIAVFNFKGGAAKTTLAINVGASLAKKGARVLIVDGDSQCNLTSFHTEADSEVLTAEQQADAATGAQTCDTATTMAAGLQEEGSEAEAEVEPEGEEAEQEEQASEVEPAISSYPLHLAAQPVRMEDLICHEKGGLDRVFDPLFRRVPSLEAAHGRIMEVAAQAQNKQSIKTHPPLPASSGADSEAQREAQLGSAFIECDKKQYHRRLWVLRGSPRFSINRDAGMGAAAGDPAEQYVKLGIFGHLLQQLSPHFDFIIVDLNPSCAALNKVMALSCDYILSPCFADSFSSSAVHGMLDNVLPDWFAWQCKVNQKQEEMLREADDGEVIHTEFLFKSAHPRVLPFICTNFDVQKAVKGDTEGHRVNKHNSSFIGTMRHFVHSFVEKYYNAEDPRASWKNKKLVARALLPNTAPGCRAPVYIVTLFPHVHGAMSVSHDLSRPLVELTRKSLVDAGDVPKRRRKTYGTVEVEFSQEVKWAKKDFGSLAAWLIWLHQHPPPPPAGAGGAAASSAAAALA